MEWDLSIHAESFIYKDSPEGFLQYYMEIPISFNILGPLLNPYQKMSTGVFWWELKSQGRDKSFIYLLESWSWKGSEPSLQLAEHGICAQLFLQNPFLMS